MLRVERDAAREARDGLFVDVAGVAADSGVPEGGPGAEDAGELSDVFDVGGLLVANDANEGLELGFAVAVVDFAAARDASEGLGPVDALLANDAREGFGVEAFERGKGEPWGLGLGLPAGAASDARADFGPEVERAAAS